MSITRQQAARWVTRNIPDFIAYQKARTRELFYRARTGKHYGRRALQLLHREYRVIQP